MRSAPHAENVKEPAMTDRLAVRIEGLRKSYGRVRALHGVDLEVHQGEIFGFLGPNGAGKTTTIRCMLDLIRPDGGRIEIFGLDPQKEAVAVRRRIGYLPGELRLEEGFTVESQLSLLSRLRGKRLDRDTLRPLAQRLDLDPRTPVRNLSKGNKQKVGVVQALMHRADLLVLDEPTFGLDPLVQHEVLRLLKEARDSGATVFFSSHILSEVEEVAERVAIIRQGVVVEVSQIADLLRRSLRRVHIRFRQPVDVAPLRSVRGVKSLREDGTSLHLEIEGEMEGLIRALAPLPLRDLETERPTLEEIFLAYYETSPGNGG
jgi:ABC-2 type transport system ATP-binding protein